MSSELEGEVAIVTGGANGIGRRIAELFAEEGAKVLIADLDAAGADLSAALGQNARFKPADVANAEDIQALVDCAISDFGGLDIMVNNAAIMGQTSLSFLDDQFEDFSRVMNVNLLGVMLGSQRAARHMSKNGGGAIINLASIAGMVPGFAYQKYRAAKAGVIQFSKSIAIDLAQHGIRVNCIAPGSIQTNITSFVEPGMDAATVDRLQQMLAPVRSANRPLQRQGVPEDVAQAALYLASDRAAQVTGIVLPIDGGITAGDPVHHLKAILETRAKALDL